MQEVRRSLGDDGRYCIRRGRCARTRPDVRRDLPYIRVGAMTRDKWQCEECDNRDPCVLLMPTDYELTATVCPYSGTDCNWQKIEDEENG